MGAQDKLQIVIDRLERLAGPDGPDCGETAGLLLQTAEELREYQAQNLDFHEIVEHVDHSIFVTDGAGNVLYVNPAYSRNTNVQPEDVLGRNVFDIVREGKVFTGGASCDVIRTGQRVFRLSTTYKTDPPLLGYTVGVPIHGADGSLSKVVVSSQPLATFRQLQGDFERFVSNLEEIRRREPVSTVNENSSTLEERPMVGCSAAMSAIWEKIRHVAASDATVLITGESGVGKEVVADEVYRQSLRNNRPYIKVNCAAIPASLLESELFGYEKGAFSGASAGGKAGLFELADGGTLLLDEIGDLPLDLQAKLLRALQNREITRVGGTRARRLDIRILSLTNSNLREKVAAGTFRRDLFYRLNVIPIQIPPLRERREDIPELIAYFLERYRRKYRREITLTPGSMEILRRYSWPGNVRELENALEYLSLCCPEGGSAQEGIVLELLRQGDGEELPQPVSSLGDAVARYEKALIEQALRNSPSMRAAAEVLGVNVSTISRKIRQYGIQI